MMVYDLDMATTTKLLRQSVSLPPRLAHRIKTIARTKRTSASRVIAELLQSGLNAQEQERRLFFELTERLIHSKDADEQKHLK